MPPLLLFHLSVSPLLLLLPLLLTFFLFTSLTLSFPAVLSVNGFAVMLAHVKCRLGNMGLWGGEATEYIPNRLVFSKLKSHCLFEREGSGCASRPMLPLEMTELKWMPEKMRHKKIQLWKIKRRASTSCCRSAWKCCFVVHWFTCWVFILSTLMSGWQYTTCTTFFRTSDTLYSVCPLLCA